MKNETNLFVRIAVALFIVLCIVTIIEVQVRMNKLNAEKEELEYKIGELKEDIEEIRYNIELPYDDNYAAKIAREILKYHYADELLFINDMYEE